MDGRWTVSAIEAPGGMDEEKLTARLKMQGFTLTEWDQQAKGSEE